MTVLDFQNYLIQAFNASDDVVFRIIKTKSGEKLLLAFFKNLTDRVYISEQIIYPLQRGDGDISDLIECVIATTQPADNIEAIKQSLLFGQTLIYSESSDIVHLCQTDTIQGRPITEPNSDVAMKGPRAGFTETIERNVAAVRGIIRSENLVFKEYVVSEVTNTRAAMAYIKGVANEKVIECISEKLSKKLNIGVVDSAVIERVFGKQMLFPVFGSSEKIDKVASKLLSGRVAVFIDGSPFVLTAPFIFAESLQASEDYLKDSVVPTIERIIRLLSILLSVYLPAVYIVLTERTPELLPKAMIDIMLKLREGLIFDTFTELIFIMIVFQFIREVGIRMPRIVGESVGLVGSIIVGDAATSAGLSSTVTVIIVAFVTICSFIVPVYTNALLLIRFAMVIAAFMFSFFGIIVVSFSIIAFLCSKESFGVPYMTPFSPFVPRGQLDFIFVKPSEALSRRDIFK